MARFSSTEVLVTLSARVGKTTDYVIDFFEIDPDNTDQIPTTISLPDGPRGHTLLLGGFTGVTVGWSYTVSNQFGQFFRPKGLSPAGDFIGFIAGANTRIGQVESVGSAHAVDVWFDRPTLASAVNPGLFFMDPGTGETTGLTAANVAPQVVRITNDVDWPADVPATSPWHVLNTDPDFFLLPPAILDPAGTVSGTVV